MSGAERPGYLEAKVNHEIFDGQKAKPLKLQGEHTFLQTLRRHAQTLRNLSGSPKTRSRRWRD